MKYCRIDIFKQFEHAVPTLAMRNSPADFVWILTSKVIVQAYRVRRSTSRYGLSHRDQSRRDVWMGVITPHFRDRCITPSWMNALGHFLSTPSPSSLPERPV